MIFKIIPGGEHPPRVHIFPEAGVIADFSRLTAGDFEFVSFNPF